MALHLKRITDPYFCCHCDVTRKIIMYPDFYYEDDEDRKMVEKTQIALQNPEIQQSLDSMSYHTMMREAERQLLEKTMFNRKLATDVVLKDLKEGGSTDAK